MDARLTYWCPALPAGGRLVHLRREVSAPKSIVRSLSRAAHFISVSTLAFTWPSNIVRAVRDDRDRLGKSKASGDTSSVNSATPCVVGVDTVATPRQIDAARLMPPARTGSASSFTRHRLRARPTCRSTSQCARLRAVDAIGFPRHAIRDRRARMFADEALEGVLHVGPPRCAVHAVGARVVVDCPRRPSRVSRYSGPTHGRGIQRIERAVDGEERLVAKVAGVEIALDAERHRSRAPSRSRSAARSSRTASCRASRSSTPPWRRRTRR